MADPTPEFIPWWMLFITSVYTWLGWLSALYVRMIWKSSELKAGHEAILHEVRALRSVLDGVLMARLIGNTQATEPQIKRRNGDE